MRVRNRPVRPGRVYGPPMRPAPDLPALLRRPDLAAIGLVLVPSGEQGTVTLWCDPRTDPEPHLAPAKAQGHALAALLLVYVGEVVGLVQPEWTRVRWLTRRIEAIAADLQQAGSFAAFAAGLAPGQLVGRN